MKALLMHRDRDFDPQRKLPWHAPAAAQDLELETLLRAMAGEDKFLLEVARKAVLAGLKNEIDIDTILYRQEIMQDCLKNPAIVKRLYDLALEAITRAKGDYWSFSSRHPGLILSGAIRALEIFTDVLRKLRSVAERHGERFESRGFTALFATLTKELSDEYVASVENHLAELKFRQGVLLSAELGKGNESANYLLRKAREQTKNWLARLLRKSPRGYTFRLHPRDEAGGRILSEMQDRGINLVANAVGQSRDHVLSFFGTLRTELAFYLGCLNLHARLASMGEPICFPRPEPVGARRQRYRELYDVCLALTMGRRVVGNAADIDGKSLVLIAGANQGGKSTFLRSVGLAQLMMQCGMFVGAESFSAELCTSLFTHFKREEDPTMKSGKLDEELGRMSEIADEIAPDSLLLCNESFAATNEREGSGIARQIVSALLEKRVKIFFVTHLYDFARGFFESKLPAAMFLRAQRKADGRRTFRVVEGEPLETSYGEDLYREVFGPEAEAEPAAPKKLAAKRAFK